MTSLNDDQLESSVKQLPSVAGAHTIIEHEQEERERHDHQGDAYQLHHDNVPLLPGQILTDTIARLRFTIVLVSMFYSGLIFIVAILAICLIAPNLLYWMDRNNPILLHTARILISLVAIGLALACIVIGLKQRELTGKLAMAEVLIDNIRDLALIQMQATRYSLEDLTERLRFPKEKNHPSAFDYIELARKIGPVIQLLMAKERSVMTLAVEGLKLFQVLKKVLNK